MDRFPSWFLHVPSIARWEVFTNVYICMCRYMCIYAEHRGSTQGLYFLVIQQWGKEEISSVIKIQPKHHVAIYSFTYILTLSIGKKKKKKKKQLPYIKYWQPCNVLNTYLFNILIRLLKKIILDTLYFHKVYAIMMSNLHLGSNSLIQTPSTLMGFRSSMWKHCNKHCFRK